MKNVNQIQGSPNVDNHVWNILISGMQIILQIMPKHMFSLLLMIIALLLVVVCFWMRSTMDWVMLERLHYTPLSISSVGSFKCHIQPSFEPFDQKIMYSPASADLSFTSARKRSDRFSFNILLWIINMCAQRLLLVLLFPIAATVNVHTKAKVKCRSEHTIPLKEIPHFHFGPITHTKSPTLSHKCKREPSAPHNANYTLYSGCWHLMVNKRVLFVRRVRVRRLPFYALRWVDAVVAAAVADGNALG